MLDAGLCLIMTCGIAITRHGAGSAATASFPNLAVARPVVALLQVPAMLLRYSFHIHRICSKWGLAAAATCRSGCQNGPLGQRAGC